MQNGNTCGVSTKLHFILLAALLVGALPAQTNLQVENFDGGPTSNDDTVRIQNALDHAMTLSGPVVVHFKSNKVYHVSKHGGGTPGVMPFALSIEGGSFITLAGHGAELRCTDRDSIILFVEKSSHIRVRNLRFDFYPCQFTQGRVTSVDHGAKTFELKIDAGHTQLDDPWFVQPDPPRPFAHHAIHLQPDRNEWVYDSVAHAWLRWQPEKTPRGTWLCESGHTGPHYAWYEELDVKKVRVGDRIVVAGLWGEKGVTPSGYPTIFTHCSDCGLESCDFFSGEAFTQCFGGTRMTVHGCRFIPRTGDAPEGVDRGWAGVGCGALFEHMDEGPQVIDSEIRCVPDDIMNFNCPPFVCYEVSRGDPDGTRLKLGGWIGPDTVEVGDTLVMSDGTTGQTKGTVIVKHISMESAFVWVTVQGTVPALNLVKARSSCIHHYATSADKIEDLNASNRNAVIRGNRFGSCGNFLRLPKMGARIEKNVFQNIAETPLMGEVNPFVWLDWPRPLGIKIHDNRFTNCQWSRGFHDQTIPDWHANDHHRLFRTGVIHLSVYRWASQMTEPIVRDIEITENVIEGWGQSAIRIEGATIEQRAERNQISGNILIEREYAHPKRFHASTPKTYPIYIANSLETDLPNTSVTLLSETSAGAVLRITGDCAPSISASFDPESRIPAGIPWVLDERPSSVTDHGPDNSGNSLAEAAQSTLDHASGNYAKRVATQRHGFQLPANGKLPTRGTGTIAALGDGCRGCNGPRLVAGSLPLIGEQFILKIVSVQDDAKVGFLFGLEEREVSLAPFGAPGCMMRVDPAITVPVAVVGEKATLPLLLPNQTALIGLEFYVQGYATDAAANRLGIVVTNALLGVIGGG